VWRAMNNTGELSREGERARRERRLG